MQLRLTGKLAVILGFGLLCLLLSSFLTRAFIELPTLRHLEFESDGKDVGQVTLFLRHLLETLAMATVDYGVWDETFRVVALEANDPELEEFARVYLRGETLSRRDLDGVVLIDSSGVIKVNAAQDPRNLRLDPAYNLDLDSLAPGALRPGPLPGVHVNSDELLNAGVSDSNNGPILFAAVRVLPTERPYPAARGTLIFWRRVSAELAAELAQQTATDLEFITPEASRRDPALANAMQRLAGPQSPSHLERDQDGRIFWLLRSVSGEPLLMVRQQAAPRIFDDRWISSSFIAGFGVSALVILLAGYAFARSIIRRLKNAEDVIDAVVLAGDFDLRLKHGGNDELDTLFEHFNRLLTYIKLQKEKPDAGNSHLELLSELDQLTGIPNRRYFDRMLDSSVRQSMRMQSALSVLMIELDHFSEYKAEHGRENTDRAVQQTAQRLRHLLVRATDHLARFDDGEFSVILLDTPPEAALRVAERLRNAIERLQIEFRVPGTGRALTASIGITTAMPGASISVSSLVQSAKAAAHRARALGGNRVVSDAGGSDAPAAAPAE